MRRTLLAVAVLAGVVGCSKSPSPTDRLVTAMHKQVPNVPSTVIRADADEVCGKTRATATQALLDDAEAISTGVDGLDVGSTALRAYARQLVAVAHSTGYCD